MTDERDPEQDNPTRRHLVPPVPVTEDVLAGVRSPEEVLALALAVFRETGKPQGGPVHPDRRPAQPPGAYRGAGSGIS